MLELVREPGGQQQTTDWRTLAESLGQQFVKSEAEADRADLFVSDNFTALKSSGLIAAGVPTELGGGGASHTELGDVLRILGSYCSSTALAFSMHTHQVMMMTWKWHHQKAPVDDLLKRIANEQLVLLSSGGSDWLQGSGTAKRVEGGFLINGRSRVC